MKDAVATEDLAAGIAEGGRLARGLGQRSVGSDPSDSCTTSAFESPRSLCHASPMVRRKKNGIDSSAASRACSSRLPEPGSM